MASMIRSRSHTPSARTARAPLSPERCRPTSVLGATFALFLCATTTAQAAFPNPTPAGIEAEIAWSTNASFSVGGAQLGPTPGSFWVAFDNRLELHDGNGNVQTVTSHPIGNSVSLLERAGSPERIYFGDFDNDLIDVVDPATLMVAETLQAPPFAFSLDVTPNGDVIVANADASFTSTDIQLLRPGQAPVLLGSLPNASGPLVIDPATGDLFYAIQPAAFPPPPGAVSIVRLPAPVLAQAIQGLTTFTIADTTVFASGLDAAFDLVQDDRGRLLATDPNVGVIQVVNRNGSLGGQLTLPNGSDSAGALDFRDRGPGTLDPYQSSDGADCLVNITRFGSFSTVQSLRGLQPTLDATNGTTLMPGQGLGLVADGLPENGMSLFTIGFRQTPGALPTFLATAPNGAPILTTIDLFLFVPAITLATMTDPMGSTGLDVPNAAPFQLDLFVEVFGLDPALTLVAVSNPVQLTLLP